MYTSSNGDPQNYYNGAYPYNYFYYDQYTTAPDTGGTYRVNPNFYEPTVYEYETIHQNSKYLNFSRRLTRIFNKFSMKKKIIHEVTKEVKNV